MGSQEKPCFLHPAPEMNRTKKHRNKVQMVRSIAKPKTKEPKKTSIFDKTLPPPNGTALRAAAGVSLPEPRDASSSIESGDLAVGQNPWYHVGAGAPPILVYFSGDWDVHWVYAILSHRHFGEQEVPTRKAGADRALGIRGSEVPPTVKTGPRRHPQSNSKGRLGRETTSSYLP